MIGLKNRSNGDSGRRTLSVFSQCLHIFPQLISRFRLLHSVTIVMVLNVVKPFPFLYCKGSLAALKDNSAQKLISLLHLSTTVSINNLIYFVSFLAQQAYFSSKPPSGVTRAKIGQNVTFHWNITLESGETLFLMSWKYSKTKMFEDSAVSIARRLNGKEASINKAFDGKVNVERNGTMTLYNVTAEQRGFYKCEVLLQDQFNEPLRDKAQLLVGRKYTRIFGFLSWQNLLTF